MGKKYTADLKIALLNGFGELVEYINPFAKAKPFSVGQQRKRSSSLGHVNQPLVPVTRLGSDHIQFRALRELIEKNSDRNF